ncbi:autotransporter-associated N-terminal domain-containing protein [Leptotrichia wadei]|uniref:autotransporter-associated N-terminal domain-containing protein n=1 Tax=Leptotrichia wadei TaxID=157687 RepID=UPI0028E6252B|nr:autotransporter-associated N-terminal domain-containing protein [Leptotrichia wadei]
MTNNLSQLKRDLKSFAKKCKDFKYTDSALFTFLLNGMLISASELSVESKDSGISNQVNLINSSIGQMRKDFKHARSENNKLIKNTNLELTQLMEQGDHVTKSPWSNWQIGANDFYNDWHGHFKGRGNRVQDGKFYQRDATMEKYNYQLKNLSTYGATRLKLDSNNMENPVEIQIDASLRTLAIDKPAPNFVPTTPSGGIPPFEPRTIAVPSLPAPLGNPVITVFNPPDLSFNGTGFGQPSDPNTDSSELYVENYHEYNTTAPVYITYTITNGRTMTGGSVKVKLDNGIDGPQLNPGTSSSQGVYFINDAADHSVTINGDYDITRATDTGNGTLYFLSLNPYEVGRNNSTDGVYDFAGNLTLHGHNNPTSGNLLLGFEHQLLANGPGGGENFTNVVNGSVTSILKNTGNITLEDGYNLVGIQIDTEYSHGADATDGFIKQPETINDGTITINSQNSIGIDYGKYYNASPNTKLTVGDINVNGKNNYGFRMKAYNGESADGGSIGMDYYDKTDITGGTGKKITVKGTNNVGVSIAQGTSSGDPLSKVTGLNILVGGTGNVGFLRNSQGNNTNSNDMVLNNTTTGTLDFSSDATESALIRSDKNGIKLDRDLTIGTAGTKNTLLQAGKTGTVTLASGKTVTSTSSNEFFGMTAGDFISSSGATIVNNGTLSIGGNKSLGMAVANSNTGTLETTGIINFTGTNGAAIYNKGTFSDKGTVNVSGVGNSGIYNNGGTLTLEGAKINGSAGSTGVYANNGTITTTATPVTKITINDTGVSKGVAVYSTGTANIDLSRSNIIVKDGAAGVVSTGNNPLKLDTASVEYDGDGYAVYTSGSGTVDLSNATLTLKGKAVGFSDTSKVTGLQSTPGGTAKIKVRSNDVILVSKSNIGALNLNGLASAVGSITGIHSSQIDTDSGKYSNYKDAAIDGATVTIDKVLDKTNIGDVDTAKLLKNLIIQKAIVNINDDVTSHLNSTQLTAIGASSVTGYDMSSSSTATSNNDTQINLSAAKTISADRTDTGNGAVGLFINYGKVHTDPSATINVEQLTTNPHNDSAVGIYAVNGSDVDNQGTVNVGGNSSIGLLGLAYREDATTGAPKVNEFGGKLGEGTINIVNKGNVTLDGTTSYGIYVKNNNASGTKTDAKGTNTGSGVLTLSGDKSIGMIGDKATLTNDAGAKINMTGQEQVGMFANNSSSLINNGEINLAASTGSIPSVGIYTDDVATDITNNGKIIGGNKNYGIFGKTVTHGSAGEITVGDEGVGIYSTEGNITLNSGSKINVGANEAVGVFTTGTAGRTINADTNMTIGDSSFGYVIKNTGTTNLTTNGTATLGNEAKFIYSNNKDITVTNNVPLTSTGNNTYGIYSAGTVTNNADIDFGRGTGSVAIYAIDGGTARNAAGKTITVSGSNLSATPVPEYGMGMATSNGTIINDGTIKVALDEGIGMFASGSGSKAINNGTIELSGKNTKGMYVDNNAVGENWGIIKTVPTANNDGILGVVATGGGVIKNYGQIIVDGPNNKAGYLGSTGTFSNETSGGTTGTVTNTNGADGVVRKVSNPTSKTVAGIEIIAPPAATAATIKINNNIVIPTVIDTNISTPNPSVATVTSPDGTVTTIDLGSTRLGSIPSNEQVGALGMYIDTSGVNYTHPIEGLNNLTGLKRINLIFGNEAARYTDSKVIEVGDNIINPYNNMILSLAASSSGMKFALNAGSLTWFATATQNLSTGALGKVYLVKIPYTAFAQDGNTYNFLGGLEQRYGVETTGREKELFNKLNDLGKGESHILAQAVDEMKGHQYANIQQRTNATGNALDNEFSYLRNEWRNPTKQNNKIKAFGLRDEYSTDTAGIFDYKSNAYGVAYVHEDEKVRMGNSSGWYAGAVTNRFRFKDLGKSREDQTMIKAGIFKTMSPKKDYNGALQWTVAGDVFAGINNMKRKFWGVDDTFEAKSTYHTYGAALKNELSYDIRMSERTHLRPFGVLKMEYGRFNDVKENSGQVRLQVKGNDYFSVKPETGVEFKYVQPLAVKTNLTVGLTAAYENEIGKLQNGNQARVRYTTADWYNLEKEKEDRRGNGKFDLNIGVDNTRFGITVNAGYDTKGNNVRGGIGFRAIY